MPAIKNRITSVFREKSVTFSNLENFSKPHVLLRNAAKMLDFIVN